MNRRVANKENIIALSLNGQEILAAEKETILQAAKRHEIEIPHLCYSDSLRPD